MKNIRIGDVELHKTKSLEDKEYWEIVKWYPNHLYGKQDEYIEIEPNCFQEKEHPNCYVSGRGMFERPQSCYTIYIVEETKEEPDLRSVGRRPYDLEEDATKDLQEVIHLLYKYYENDSRTN